MSIDLVVDEHGIAIITMNRPERLNALDNEHYENLSKTFTMVRDDPAVRVVVVTGAGERSFSTGADLKSPMPRTADRSQLMMTQKTLLPNRGLEIWKPIVAAVNGHCLAGGMCLLMATDIRLAAPHATFGLAEIKRGGIPGNGGTQRVVQQLPYPIAMEMLLLGKTLDAETALRWGLVNRVVPGPELMDAALEVARQLASMAPLAVQAAKELGLRSRDLDLSSGIRLEQSLLSLIQASEDWKEGLAAFAEKRQPQFQGR